MQDNEIENINEDEYENSENIENPFSTKNIKISSAVILLPSLMNRIKYKEIDIPKFQRNENLWTNKQMSRLIESILLKLPLPIFYFDVSNPEKWLIVDGLQRMSAINKFFVTKELKLTSLEFLIDLNGKKYDDFEEENLRRFNRIIDDTEFQTYQIEAQTPKKVRYSIFNRINTGGLSLNAQEIRQALNQDGKAVEFLENICNLNIFKEIVKVSSKRMLDRELALRFISFKLVDYDNFTFNNMGQFLDEGMEQLDKITDDNQLVNLKQELIETLELSEKILGNNHGFSRSIAFDNKTKTLNRSLFDVLTVCFSEINNKNLFISRKNKFRDLFLKILKDENSLFSKSITEGTSGKIAIGNRFKIIRDLINEVLNEN